MKPYAHEFYVHRHENTRHAAHTILSLLLERIPPIHSAVDIGCGVGTWLSVLQEKGVNDIHGLDGSWVDLDHLAIPRACFEHVDLSQAVIPVPRRYDLAISVEVAEHLPADRAKAFVSCLTALSDTVLFSAAIPFQGGTNHINEQWQHYWVTLFGVIGYVVQDWIRPQIWNDTQIPFWYRQNILVFSKRQTAEAAHRHSSGLDTWSMPLDLVHPDLYLSKTQIGVKGSYRLLCRSLRDYIRKMFGAAGRDE